MDIQLLNPKKALNKAWLKVKPARADIERFKAHLIRLIDRTDEKESEEFHKNLISDFLKDTYYKDRHFINTKGRNDLVVHNGPDAKTPVGILLEAKKPGNKNEMASREKLNTKAFQELLLYYLRERFGHKNVEIRHLIITNIHEWFIFDATQFDRLFAQNAALVRQFNDFEAGRLADTRTDFFYKSIAGPFVAGLNGAIECCWFRLADYEKPLRNADPADDTQLIALYKLLSPEHLLKLPFANDSNSLDKRFYSELLHLIGLSESKNGSKKLIGRNPEGSRHSGALLENTITQLDQLDKLRRLPNPARYGDSREERLFNVAMELCITWVNRILFLKLLEAQLIAWHNGDRSYAFLDKNHIRDYDELNTLFFSVLARLPEARLPDIAKAFAHVPYLNSSLFELSDIENDTLVISNLRDERRLPLHPQTVLRDDQGKNLRGEYNALDYLLEFLDAYDFGSEGAEAIQEQNKTLISASVLGLIFEKINGYRDGAFFTPGFVTMYMCRESIRKAVVQKFNEEKQWNCQSPEELYDRISDRQEANDIFNRIKICDPAVGSGHFLVSALNELIVVKHELKILQDRSGRRLKEYHLEVLNDELIVTDEAGELFVYKPLLPESQRVQEALFHEKQSLIENCLFGVDINPNSVKICRLRLWIELLKHAYYKEGQALETLPNIDINIKCGNSLVSRFALDASLKQALRKSKWSVEAYRNAVQAYRSARSKDEKHGMEELIAHIKGDFRTEIGLNDPKRRKLSLLRGELDKLTLQTSLFERSEKEMQQWRKEVARLTAEVQAIEAEFEAIQQNRIYENAFEWRFEFPEALNDEGEFEGFDVVIGNPPYIRQEELGALKGYLQQHYRVYAGTADLYAYFVELGMRLLKSGGHFAYILPNKWMRAGYGKALRAFLMEKELHGIVDFGDLPVFEEATTYPCILTAANRPGSGSFMAATVQSLDMPEGLQAWLQPRLNRVEYSALQADGWNLGEPRVQALLQKIRKAGRPLGEYVQGKIYRGVLTGLNEAFVIDTATRNALIAADARSAEVIKPFLAGRDIKRYRQPESDKYVLFIPWHFPLHEDNSITGASIEAEEAFSKAYPAVYQHLLQFKDALESRNKAETGVRYEWYALQRCAATYYAEFEREKIIIPAIVKSASYGFDEEGHYSNDKTSIIPVKDYHLLGLLNSRLIDFFVQQIASTKQNGFYEYKPVYISQIPIAAPLDEGISALVSEILSLRRADAQADTALLEQEINRRVYALYGLSAEEVTIVEE